MTVLGMQAGVQDQSPRQPFPACFSHSCLLRCHFHLPLAEKRVSLRSLGHYLKAQTPC